MDWRGGPPNRGLPPVVPAPPPTGGEGPSLITLAEVQALHGPSQRQRLVSNLIYQLLRAGDAFGFGARLRGDWLRSPRAIKLLRQRRLVVARTKCPHRSEQLGLAEMLDRPSVHGVEAHAQAFKRGCIEMPDGRGPLGSDHA